MKSVISEFLHLTKEKADNIYFGPAVDSSRYEEQHAQKQKLLENKARKKNNLKHLMNK